MKQQARQNTDQRIDMEEENPRSLKRSMGVLNPRVQQGGKQRRDRDLLFQRYRKYRKNIQGGVFYSKKITNPNTIPYWLSFSG